MSNDINASDRTRSDLTSYGSMGSDQRTDDSSRPQEDISCNYCFCCSCRCTLMRYFTAVMICLGLVILHGNRTNVGVATTHFRDLYDSSVNSSLFNTSANWQGDPLVLGWVDSCSFIGFLITHIPGGILANKYSASAVFSVAIFVNAALNLLLPVAFSTHFGLVIAVRFVQGLFEGCTIPASKGVLRYWSPMLERSRLSAIVVGSFGLGFAVGLFLSGVLTDHVGWSVPFYAYGSAGILWFCAWQFCIYEKPSQHPFVSKQEREYIENSIDEDMDVHEKISDIPWYSIFTSMPVYAAMVTLFARKWTTVFLTVESYKYFKDCFDTKMTHIGVYTALPYSLIGGNLADGMRERGVPTTIVRKLFCGVGFGIEAAFLLGVGLARNVTVAVTCLCFAMSFAGLAQSGFGVNLLDIAPRYVSILSGVIETMAGVANLVAPVVTLQIAKDRTHHSWLMAFVVAGAFYVVSVIFYSIFASGEEQDWARAPPAMGKSSYDKLGANTALAADKTNTDDLIEED